MTSTEDPAAVLEAFIHDVANLPAEIQHLYEEAQVKQDQITDCQRLVDTRDGNLQKFIKHNTSLVLNPKEEQYSKAVADNYEKMRLLQDEKVMLIEKASTLLDRYVKRLDKKIADLQSEGAMPLDPQMPSLLRISPGNLVAASSATGTGASTPLQPISVNTVSTTSSSLANEAIRRLAHATNAQRSGGAPAVLNIQNNTIASSQLAGAQVNAALNAINRGPRESSTGSEKRRRLMESLGSLPPKPSNLARQSSIGPGTPKPATPGGSRAGSTGPRPVKKVGVVAKKAPMGSQLARKKLTKGGLPKKSARRLLGSNNPNRASPSTTAGESDVSGAEGSEDENSAAAVTGPGVAEGDEDMDDVAEDDTKYCYCGQVSYGNMVACDNADCKGQWFHWKCAGITEEPQGEWLCKNCAKLPASKIRREKDEED